MEFRILGQLEVVSAGRRLDLGGHKQRAVLALLLLEANHPVALHRIVDLLWDGRPPAQGAGTVRAYVSNLRRLLEPERHPGAPASVLASEAGGYVLWVAPEQLDAARFEALVRCGRELLAAGDSARSQAVLADALALWRGPALADFADEPFAWTEAARLEECRLAAVEEHAEAALACGNEHAVVADLEALLAAHPLRERLRGQLMVALYRCGRQADALRVCEAGRRMLAEELGIDPSPALRELERAILDHDPSLGSVRPPAPAAASGLVGRDGQLEVLRMKLGEAVAGRGQVVLIGGEPGIGKTRLAQALAAGAEQAGATVVWGTAHDGDGAPAFWPWVQILRRLIETGDSGTVRDALGADAGQLAQIVPEVAGAGPAPVADPDLARFRLYDAVTRFLLRLSRHTPLAVILDDVHWADVPSLQLLSFLAAALEDDRILVVATYREAEVATTPALAAALAALTRRPAVTRLRLEGLSEADVRRLVTELTPEPPGGDVVSALHRRTGGNPFFVVELARLYAETHSLDAVPPTVRDVVRHNASRLSDPARDVLAGAAVLGQEFDLDVLAEVADLDVERALALAEEAVALGIVVETSVPGRLRFSHALTRDTVYEELSALRRARLHGRAGTVLELRRHAGGPELVAQIAHHFLQASALGFVAEAIEYAEAAAAGALAGLAFEQAERHLRSALGLVPRVPAGAERSRLELRLRMQLASLLFTTKGYSDAGVLPALSRALDLCREVGTRHQLLATLWGTWGYAMGLPDLPLARKLAEELLDEARRTGEPAYTVTGHVAAGMTMVHEGGLEEGCAHLRLGTTVADDAGADIRRQLAEVDLSEVVLEKHPWVGGHGLHGVALYLRGDDAGALAEVEAAHSFARQIGQPFGMTLAHVIECGLHGARDDAASLAAAAVKGLETARRHGFRQWELTLLALQGWARADLGDADAGIEQAETAIEQLAAGGNGMLRHLLLGLLARAQRGAGRTQDALATVDSALKASETTGERFYEAELHRLRGELLLEREPDRPAPARECFETALLVARRQGSVALQRRAEGSLARLGASGVVPADLRLTGGGQRGQ
jgi:DNA-binding SARP family transcriptional activator